MGDYIRFNLCSEKNAPKGSFNTHDGTIVINLDEIYYIVETENFCYIEENLIAELIDVLLHEELHKRISESSDDQDTFNEQDERVFRIINDWVYFDRKKSITDYD